MLIYPSSPRGLVDQLTNKNTMSEEENVNVEEAVDEEAVAQDENLEDGAEESSDEEFVEDEE